MDRRWLRWIAPSLATVALGVVVWLVASILLGLDYERTESGFDAYARTAMEGTSTTTTTTVPLTTASTTTTTLPPTTSTTTTTTVLEQKGLNPFYWNFKPWGLGAIPVAIEHRLYGDLDAGAQITWILIGVELRVDDLFYDEYGDLVIPIYYGTDAAGTPIILNHLLEWRPDDVVAVLSSSDGMRIPVCIEPAAECQVLGYEFTHEEFRRLIKPDQVYPIGIFHNLVKTAPPPCEDPYATGCEALYEWRFQSAAAIDQVLAALRGDQLWTGIDTIAVPPEIFASTLIVNGVLEWRGDL